MAWLVTEQRQQLFLLVVFRQDRLHLDLLWNHEQVEGLDDIFDIHDRSRAILDQLVRAGALARKYAAWDGEHLAPLLQGVLHGYQRPTFGRSFDDKHAQREAGDDAVARREIAALRFRAERIFAQDHAPARFDDAVRQGAVRRRVDDIQ